MLSLRNNEQKRCYKKCFTVAVEVDGKKTRNKTFTIAVQGKVCTLEMKLQKCQMRVNKKQITHIHNKYRNAQTSTYQCCHLCQMNIKWNHTFTLFKLQLMCTADILIFNLLEEILNFAWLSVCKTKTIS